MCYWRTDELLKKIENEWMQEWQRIYDEGDEAAHEAQENWYFRFNTDYPDACCSDILVAMQDDLEQLRCTPMPGSSSD